jgi:hypothetical protein
LLARWIALPAAEREAMRARALECFHRRYDMRENAKKIARLFETAPAKRSCEQATSSSNR